MQRVNSAKSRFLVLGATGMQGKIATQWLKDRGHIVYESGHQVRTDRDLNYHRFDLSLCGDELNVNPEGVKQLTELFSRLEPDVILNCAEGNWDLAVYQAALAAGCHVCDLGSEIPMTGQQLKMFAQFESQGVVSVSGLGSTPGVSNIMLRYISAAFSSMHSIDCGFVWDSNSKEFVPPFSLESVIEEFHNPATAVLRGKFVSVQPMRHLLRENPAAMLMWPQLWSTEHSLTTEPDYTYLQLHTKHGQDLFSTNRLFPVRHPEPFTFYHTFKHLGVQNIRFWAGFPEQSFNTIQALSNLGFSSKQAVQELGVSPVEFICALYREKAVPEKYQEREVIWVQVAGELTPAKKKQFQALGIYKQINGRDVITMEMVVPPLALGEDWREHGCNVDTGIPAAIIAEMIVEGLVEPGSWFPEQIINPKEFFSRLPSKMKIYCNGELLSKVSND